MEITIPANIRSGLNERWPWLAVPEHAEAGVVHSTHEDGWVVSWRVDEEDGQAVVYWFSDHRMTDPALYRGTAEGVEGLGSGCTMYAVRAGQSREEALERMRADVRAFWQQVGALGLDGTTTMATAINTALGLGLVGDDAGGES